MYPYIAPSILWLFALTTLVLSFFNTSIPSPYWWFTTTTCGVLGIWLMSRTEQLQRYKDQRAKDCEDVLKRIRQEIPNFKQLRNAQETGREFGGYHKKAVEEYSFELTGDALNLIQKYWKYSRLSRAISHELTENKSRDIKDMKIETLLDLMSQLEKTLAKECGK